MDVTRKTYRFDPLPTETGLRLDQFLPARTPELSRGFSRKIIDLGGVHVGGRRVRRCSHPVKAGEPVEVYLDGLPLEVFSLAPANILYRDAYVLAVSKPSGVETQPTPARYKGTLYEALLRYLRNPYRPLDAPALGMVQRLDRETSGLLIFSIHPRAHRGLSAAFAERRVAKTYLALVQGHPPQATGIFRSRLARSRASNRMKSVARGGKEAVTRYRILEAFPEAALLEVEILTGRTHQIRIHFAEAGLPLLGDGRYGGPAFVRGRAVPRLMLHARALSLPHPVTDAPLSLEAPLPEDFEHWRRFLGEESTGEAGENPSPQEG